MFRSRRELVAWFAVTLGLGLEIRFDRLRLIVPAYKARYQRDSDALVYRALADRDRGLVDPMLTATGDAYTSQFGLQGIVMSLVSPGTSLYGPLRLVTAFLMAAVVATAVVACWRAWGGRAAIVLLALLTTSTWLNLLGASTYWQAWTLLLPMLVPLLVWPRLGAGRRKWVRGSLLVAGLVFVKSLCGYEFISTVVIGVAAAVAFHEFRERVDRQLLVRLVAVMAAATAGFAAAVGVHVLQLLALFGTAAPIGSRAGERTFSPSTLDVVLPHVEDKAGPVTGWLLERNEVVGVWVFRMLDYLRDPAISMPGPRSIGLGPRPYDIPIVFFVVLFLLLAWHAHRGRGEDAAVQRRLALAGGIALVGSASWLVLAFGHMVHHPHIDAIVFYLPFLPLVFAMTALRVETVCRRAWPGSTTASVPPPATGSDTAPIRGLVGAGART